MGHDNRKTFSEQLRHLDFWALSSAGALFLLGVLSIFSATYGRSEEFALRQLLSGGLAMAGYGAAIAVGHDRLLRWAYPIFGTTVAVLALVLLLGTMVKGSQSWFALGPLRLQPSEMGKVALALILGKHFCGFLRMCFRSPRRGRHGCRCRTNLNSGIQSLTRWQDILRSGNGWRSGPANRTSRICMN